MSILLDGELYGREIARRFEVKTKRLISWSTLYVTLDRAKAKGLISSQVSNDYSESGSNHRKFFSLTPKGETLLRDFGRMLFPE